MIFGCIKMLIAVLTIVMVRALHPVLFETDKGVEAFLMHFTTIVMYSGHSLVL